MSCGFTVRTRTSAQATASGFESVDATPWACASSRARSSRRLVIMISSAPRPPERIRPETKASPIRPPPRKATLRSRVWLIRPLHRGPAPSRPDVRRPPRPPLPAHGRCPNAGARGTPDPRVAPFGDEGLAMDQAGVELLAPEDVLEAFGDPVEHRGDHLDVDVVADLAATDPELDELEGPVRILAPHQPVDRPPEPQPGVVPPDRRHTVGHPLLGEELLRPPEPVVRTAQNPASTTSAGASSHAGSCPTASRYTARNNPPCSRNAGRRSPWRPRPRRRCPRRARPGTRARRSAASRHPRSARVARWSRCRLGVAMTWER